MTGENQRGTDEFNADPTVGGKYGSEEGAGNAPKILTPDQIKAIAERNKGLAGRRAKDVDNKPIYDNELASFLGSDDMSTGTEQAVKPSKNVETLAIDPFDDYSALGPAQTPDVDAMILKSGLEEINTPVVAEFPDKKKRSLASEQELRDLKDDFEAELEKKGYKTIKVDLKEKDGKYILTIRFAKKDQNGRNRQSREITGEPRDIYDTIRRDLRLPTKKGR